MTTKHDVQGWVVQVVIVAVALLQWNVLAGPPGQMSWYNNAVMWQEVIGGQTHYSDMRVNNGVVQFFSDNSWWGTNVTPSQYQDFYNSHYGSGYGSGTYGDAIRTYQQQQGQSFTYDTINVTVGGREYRLHEQSYAHPCCGEDSLCGLAVYCMDCLGCMHYQAPADKPNWVFSLGSSTSYTNDKYRLVGLARPLTETVGVSVRETVSGTWTSGRFQMNLLVPYAENHYGGDMDALDNRSLGLQAIPRYFLLEQRADGIDLNLVLSAGYSHAWFDHAIAGVDEPESATLGGGLGIGKTTRYGDFRLGYVYQPTWAIGGDTQLTGHANMDNHAIAARYTGLVVNNLLCTLGATYLYTPGLPSIYDNDAVQGEVGLQYVQKDWLAGVSFNRSFYNDNLRQWGLTLDVAVRW